jgi:ankyrin repeat protein
MMTVVFSASTTSLASAEKQLGPRTPLQTAILAGDEQRARELVDQGAAVDEGLISAARTANGPLLELLIASGADAASFFGARALVVAMLVDSDDAVKVLRSNGAHLEAEDEAGRTVLVWASGQKRLGPLVRTAIAAGADLEAASRTGESALMTASRFARVGSVRMLLKAGAPVDARDRDGWTPLMFAVRSQSTKIVDMLLDAGADPEAESTLGWTPLMLAAREGKARIVNRLLRAGADPDRRTEMGYEPLVRAVQGGHGAAARRLLARGAEVGDGTPGDPIWWARELRRQHLRKLLVSAGREEG